MATTPSYLPDLRSERNSSRVPLAYSWRASRQRCLWWLACLHAAAATGYCLDVCCVFLLTLSSTSEEHSSHSLRACAMSPMSNAESLPMIIGIANRMRGFRENAGGKKMNSNRNSLPRRRLTAFAGSAQLPDTAQHCRQLKWHGCSLLSLLYNDAPVGSCGTAPQLVMDCGR